MRSDGTGMTKADWVVRTGGLEHIYETILSTTDDFAYVFSREGQFLYANAHLLRVWAKTLDEVIGKTCYELGYPKWHADMHMREIREIVETKKSIRGEVPFTGESGVSGIYDYIFQPVLDADGNVEVIVGTTRDVKQRKEYEKKLEVAQMQLQHHALELEEKVSERTVALKESIEALETFSYGIAHDLKAPLRAMQAYAEILSAEYKAEFGPEALLYLQRISKAARRMDKLIKDVLALTQVSHGTMDLQPLDPGALLHEIIGSYPDIAAHRNEIQVESGLPKVMANEAALTQCLTNLIGNALKFVAAGTVPRLAIRAETHGDRTRIVFSDNGIGIAPDETGQIFDLFQRGTSGQEGSGLGLSIVKKAVERMGGRVGVESTVGSGSSFWLELKSA
jgi:PAS domain S-box-containing protein